MFGATLTMQEMAKRRKACESTARYRAKNRDKINARQRELYALDPQKHVRAVLKSRRRNKQPSYEADKKYRKAIRRDPNLWPKNAMRVIRARCHGTDIPVTITAADIVVPDRCPVLGVAFVFDERGPYSPTVDRFVPSLGYVPGNVRVISALANQIKSNCVDPEVFRRVALYVEGRL